jgi:endonuclease/exonuclease/phosphatase family metal-dependent hydrolase
MPQFQFAQMIFCGKFNANRMSPVYCGLACNMTDVQRAPRNPGQTRTIFSGRSSLLRIDHIFVTQYFQTLNATLSKKHDTQPATDHLSIFAALELIGN